MSNPDKYIAEKLGLCAHDWDCPDFEEDACTCKKCGAQEFLEDIKRDTFSQSVPLLKAEAKRAGLWERFIEWVVSDNARDKYWNPLAEFFPAASWADFAEILTDPALCAQAFEAFLKEREGK